jgi:hypothetical protein
MEVSFQLHTPVALPLGRNPRYPLNSRLDEPQRRPGPFVEGINFVALTRIRTLDCPARNLFAIPTTVFTVLKRINQYVIPENPGVYRTEIGKSELRG